MAPNPLIVLVPGAFHLDSSMNLLAAELQKAGYKTHSFGLLTVNRAHKTVKDDAIALHIALSYPFIETHGMDVVLYLHSYAGFPGSAAIGGLSKTERSAKGLKGGIIGLIYQSAFLPKPTDTLLGMANGNYAPWQAPNVSLEIQKQDCNGVC